MFLELKLIEGGYAIFKNLTDLLVDLNLIGIQFLNQILNLEMVGFCQQGLESGFN